MKHILHILSLLSFALLIAFKPTPAPAQQIITNKPLGIVEVPVDTVEITTPTLDVNQKRVFVLRAEALQKVFLTTDTVIGTRSRVITYINGNEQLTSRTQVIQKVRTTVTAKFVTRIKPGYFLDPLAGAFYKTTDTLTK